MITAYLRPDSWDLPLFLHVLGAMLLFGGTIALTAFAFVGSRGRMDGRAMSRLAFRTLLFVVLPSWILTRVAAQWLLSRENDQIAGIDDRGWVGVGFAVTEGGLLLLLIVGVLTFLASRRERPRRTINAAAVLGIVYLVALAVAWWVMTTKPGS